MRGERYITQPRFSTRSVPWPGTQRVLTGFAVAAAGFVSFGTVAALWENPFFFRMTPVDGWEIGLLATLSILGGVYAAMRRRHCSDKAAGAAGVLGFIGVACPVCNKILLLAFGSELLLTYYEPIRVHVASVGVIVAIWAIHRECRRQSESKERIPVRAQTEDA